MEHSEEVVEAMAAIDSNTALLETIEETRGSEIAEVFERILELIGEAGELAKEHDLGIEAFQYCSMPEEFVGVAMTHITNMPSDIILPEAMMANNITAILFSARQPSAKYSMIQQLLSKYMSVLEALQVDPSLRDPVNYEKAVKEQEETTG